jgi:gamma-glutamylcyclotransferase (GGCT)/AIG2-like uncharacterized protein YtfP
MHSGIRVFQISEDLSWTVALDLLFVYGTLRSEFDNPYARLLRSQGQLLGPATVPGSIYRIDYYPGYRPEPAAEVHGELYRLADPASTLKALDEYEGPDFERVIRNGAWLYQYRNSPPADSRISSGDFCAP